MDMIKVGPVGECDGTLWDEKGRYQVAGILVSYSQDSIDSLQFLFRENGNLLLSKKHGVDYCENFCSIVFDYPSEFLTSLSGSYGKLDDCFSTVMQTIKFVTNKSSYGPFGTNTRSNTKEFNFHLGNHNNLFGGLHGTYNCPGVEGIGVYLKNEQD
ncbi:inactive protein RESTRICTED TEV MOVEMENT 1-like [Solanum dulcamara]|uniref:inactive protein RESTRICTED TEV MOVEMENT 1-like n=1 Tax=Solanum dulcamara TaxID=45834 RepID=UPI002485F750|nr:inactive protein RESTRICTED TEV MOVEMENT 1-like [Solanum dulcamara]